MRTTPRLLASPSRRATRALSRALALAVGLVVWAVSAHAWAAIVVAIDSPTSGAGINGTLSLRASSTALPVQAITASATVNGVPEPMLVNAAGTAFGFNMPLATVPYGPVTVVVTATNAAGEVATASATYFNDALPTVTFTEPMDGTLGRPSVHVEASCSTTGLYPCRVLPVGRPDDGVMRTTLSEDVTIHDSAEHELCVTARTTVGLSARACRGRFWRAATSSRMIEERTFDGPIEDIDATRVLYSVRVPCGATTCMEGRIYDRATGAITVLPGRDYRYLTALGAVGNSSEWRSGVLLPLSVGGGQIWARNNTIIWVSHDDPRDPYTGALHYRDILTGREGVDAKPYPLAPGKTVAAVADNGIGVFTSSISALMRVEGGVANQIFTTWPHKVFAIDDVQVVTSYSIASSPQYAGTVAVRTSAPYTVGGCANGANGSALTVFPTIATHGGNFVIAAAKGEAKTYLCLAGQRWLIAAGIVPAVEGLDGTLRAMLRNAGTRYEARQGPNQDTPAPLVSLGSPTGKLRLLGSTWYAIAGRMLYRIDDGPTAPGGDAGAPGDAGIGDAGVTDAGTGDAAVTDASSSLDASDDAATDGSTPSDASSATDAALADGGATSTPDAATASDASIASDAGTGSGDAGGGTPEEPAGCSQAGGAGSLAPSALVLVGLAVYRRRKRGAR